MLIEVSLDSEFEFRNAMEHAALDRLVDDQAEEPFDQIGPRGRAGDELDMKAASLEPGFDLALTLACLWVLPGSTKRPSGESSSPPSAEFALYAPSQPLRSARRYAFSIADPRA